MRLSQLKFGQAFMWGHTDDLCVYGTFDGKNHIFFSESNVVVGMNGASKISTMHYAGDCEVKPVVMPWMLKALQRAGFLIMAVETAINNHYKLTKLSYVKYGSWFLYNGKRYMKLNYDHPSCSGCMDEQHKFMTLANDHLVETE